MKKVLFFAAAAMVAVGCSSAQTQSEESAASLEAAAKYQIIDQEFDNVLAPETDYDKVIPYEEQISNSSYLQSVRGGKKPSRKTAPKADVNDEEPVPEDSSK